MITDDSNVMVVETNIDDMNPQHYSHVIDLLLEQGALDAYLTPVIMKKGRPGILLSALVPEQMLDNAIDVILRETTTIGVRFFPVERRILPRFMVDVPTRYGTIRIKVVRHGTTVRYTPEYDDCLAAARTHDVSLQEVQDAVRVEAEKIDLDGLL